MGIYACKMFSLSEVGGLLHSVVSHNALLDDFRFMFVSFGFPTFAVAAYCLARILSLTACKLSNSLYISKYTGLFNTILLN